jgi:DNA repair exonuclease SbcCD ATPase subunit
MGMRLKTFLSAVVSTAVLAGPAAQLFAQSQSLGDIARQEEERRQTVKEPAKVYTNKDLGNVPPAPPAPPPETLKPPSTSTGEASKQAEKDKEKGKETDKTATKDQAYWAGRVKQLQEQLDRDQTYADAMQSRINGLNADFTARDDPAQRTVLDNDRRKALAELDRLKQAIVTDKKAIADLQDEARRTGVPPGWLR